jgi:hypothetical protein
MRFERQKIRLTSFEEGGLVSRNGFFEEPFMNNDGGVGFKKVYKTGLVPSDVSKVTTLNEDCVDFYADDKPRHIDKNVWRNMGRNRRISENLKLLVGHKNFKFEYL